MRFVVRGLVSGPINYEVPWLAQFRYAEGSRRIPEPVAKLLRLLAAHPEFAGG
jgi:hypothetical protein